MHYAQGAQHVEHGCAWHVAWLVCIRFGTSYEGAKGPACARAQRGCQLRTSYATGSCLLWRTNPPPCVASQAGLIMVGIANGLTIIFLGLYDTDADRVSVHNTRETVYHIGVCMPTSIEL